MSLTLWNASLRFWALWHLYAPEKMEFKATYVKCAVKISVRVGWLWDPSWRTKQRCAYYLMIILFMGYLQPKTQEKCASRNIDELSCTVVLIQLTRSVKQSADIRSHFHEEERRATDNTKKKYGRI